MTRKRHGAGAADLANITLVERALIRHWSQERRSQRWMATQLARSGHTIAAVLRDLGLPTGRPAHNSQGTDVPDDDEIAEMVRLYGEEGMGFRAIATTFAAQGRLFSKDRVRRALAAAGVTFRPGPVFTTTERE